MRSARCVLWCVCACYRRTREDACGWIPHLAMLSRTRFIRGRMVVQGLHWLAARSTLSCTWAVIRSTTTTTTIITTTTVALALNGRCYHLVPIFHNQPITIPVYSGTSHGVLFFWYRKRVMICSCVGCSQFITVAVNEWVKEEETYKTKQQM
jgi:hypothetical protein